MSKVVDGSETLRMQQEIDFLHEAVKYFSVQNTKKDVHAYIYSMREKYKIVDMCRWMGESRSSVYATINAAKTSRDLEPVKKTSKEVVKHQKRNSEMFGIKIGKYGFTIKKM